MKDRVKATLRGNRLTVEMSDADAGIMFRVGLQKYVDEKCGKCKVKVVPVEDIKASGKSIDLTHKEWESFVKDGILEAIRSQLDRMEKEVKPKGGKV